MPLSARAQLERERGECETEEREKERVCVRQREGERERTRARERANSAHAVQRRVLGRGLVSSIEVVSIVAQHLRMPFSAGAEFLERGCSCLAAELRKNRSLVAQQLGGCVKLCQRLSEQHRGLVSSIEV
jgi:hypothetical protein